MGNTFGHLFRVTTWGESHGDAVGVVVDGCPPRIPISVDDIQPDLDRRRPGQSEITTQRQEGDRAEILSGVFDGLTLGKNGAELLYLGYVVAYGLVACHTQAHRRDGGGRALGNVSVAEGAI